MGDGPIPLVRDRKTQRYRSLSFTEPRHVTRTFTTNGSLYQTVTSSPIRETAESFLGSV